MKRGKEIKLDYIPFDQYNVVCGTVDNKNPKAVYISMSAWGEPHDDSEVNYDRVIRNLHKKVKQTLFDYMNTDRFHEEKTIVDLDMRESGIAFNKRSFMNCEVTLYQVGELPINDDSMLDAIEEITQCLIDFVFDNNDYFQFHKKKK